MPFFALIDLSLRTSEMQILLGWAFVIYTTVDFNHQKDAPIAEGWSSCICPTNPERQSQTVVPALRRLASNAAGVWLL
jgi:hypothetical protein